MKNNADKSNDMGNRSIRFEEMKNELKKFSNQLPEEINVHFVPERGGLFNLSDYDVKGDDLNTLAKNLQENLIIQNNNIKNITKKFDTIYETFNSLDKDYIQRILMSLKSAEEANRKSNKNYSEIRKSQNSIAQSQDDITQLLENNKIIVKILTNWKEKIDVIEHLYDIDELYFEFYKMQETIQVHLTDIMRQLDKQDTMIELLSKEKMQSVEDNLSKLSNELDQLKHIFKIEKETYQSDVINLKRQSKISNGLAIGSVIITVILSVLVVGGII